MRQICEDKGKRADVGADIQAHAFGVHNLSHQIHDMWLPDARLGNRAENADVIA